MHDTDINDRHPDREFAREEIRRRLADPSLVLGDVLPRVAFEEAHIPGSISLPVEEISTLAPEVIPDGAQEIAVYCGGPT